MNKDIGNTQNSENQEISFAFLWKVFKKNWIIILALVLVAGLASAGITSAVVLSSGDVANYSATVQLKYINSNLSNDEDTPKENIINTSPIALDGSVFEPKSIINDEVVKSALTDVGVNDARIFGIIKSNLTVAQEGNSDKNKIADKFTISIPYIKNIGFNDGKFIAFLNSVAENYAEYFEKQYDKNKSISMALKSDSIDAIYDYIELVDLYNVELTKASNHLSVLWKTNSEVYEKNSRRLKAEMTELATVRRYILNNNVKKTDSISLDSYLSSQKALYTSKKTECENGILTLDKEIEDFVGASTVESINGIIKVEIMTPLDKMKLEKLKTKRLELKDQVAYYTTQLAQIDVDISMLNKNTTCTSEQVTNVRTNLANSFINVSEVFADVQKDVGDYYKMDAVKNGVQLVAPATKHSRMALNILLATVSSIMLMFALMMVILSYKEYRKDQKEKREQAKLLVEEIKATEAGEANISAESEKALEKTIEEEKD